MNGCCDDSSERWEYSVLVRNLMIEDATTIRPDASLREALELLDSKDYHALPVTTDGHQLEGIIAQKDIWKAVRQLDSFTKAMDLKVADVMTRKVVTVKPDDLVERAAKTMWQIQHPILPVVDDGELRGILSEADIAKGYAEMLGVDEPDTVRLMLVVPDRIGQLSRLGEVFADHHANITHVATYHSRVLNQYIMVVRVAGDLPKTLELELERHGYKILRVDYNS